MLNTRRQFLRCLNQIHFIRSDPKISKKYWNCGSFLNYSSLSQSVEDESNALSDTFGNLRQSLENRKPKASNVRVIRVKKFTPKKGNEANKFGKLSERSPIWYPEIRDKPKIDNDQSDDSTMVRNISRWQRDPRAYLEKMKTLVNEKRLKEALDLFVEMKRNFVVPLHAHFTFMIGACGRAGYTEMAFKLLRQMTDRGMQPTPASLTGVFNSCAESPYPEYGLKKARALKEKIETKNWEMTQLTYHAMIKAFGRCGDLETAFRIVDEMAAADVKIDVSTYCFLLMSCIENKEAGCTHAIEVWRKMKKRRCIPNSFACNLLLRAIRDCDIGPEEVSCLLLQHWSNYLKRPYGFKRKELVAEKPILQIAGPIEVKSIEESPEQQFVDEIGPAFSSKEDKQEQKNSTVIEKQQPETNLQILKTAPSVLGQRPEGSTDVLDLGTIKTSSDRLSLIGGARGFLREMKEYDIKPTIKTFTLLLESLPPCFEAEEELITALETCKVTPDMGFFNILMKRRIFRHEDSSAKEALQLINKWCLCPDVITFGVLASGCRHHVQANEFLRDLKKLGFCPNIQIAGALMANACTHFDFKYMQHVLMLMQDEDIKPNKKLLTRINKTLETSKKNMIDMEHGREVDKRFKKEKFSKLYKEFCDFYDSWLPKMKFEKEENVWNQYKTDIVEKYEIENTSKNDV